jgi:hypothetical protein
LFVSNAHFLVKQITVVIDAISCEIHFTSNTNIRDLRIKEKTLTYDILQAKQGTPESRCKRSTRDIVHIKKAKSVGALPATESSRLKRRTHTNRSAVPRVSPLFDAPMCASAQRLDQVLMWNTATVRGE